MGAALPPPCFRCRVSTVNVVSACLQKDTSRGEERGCQCRCCPVHHPPPALQGGPRPCTYQAGVALCPGTSRLGLAGAGAPVLDHIASTWDGSDGPSQPPGAQRAAEAYVELLAHSVQICSLKGHFPKAPAQSSHSLRACVPGPSHSDTSLC